VGAHRVVALAIADVVAFDLAIPGQVFGHRDERVRYSFAACAARAGALRSTTVCMPETCALSLTWRFCRRGRRSMIRRRR
jgi:hypothetical protein